MDFEKYVFCFFIYAFLGYICEVVYCSIGQKKLVNRGYLYMPVCPIYGFGAIIILLAMLPISNLWYLVFLLGILLTSTLEYLTSYFMELIFHMRWWDYSKRFLNINGRVCLLNSFLFGCLVMVVIYGIHPIIFKFMDKLGVLTIRIMDILLFIAILIDTIFSTIKNMNIAKVVAKINQFTEEAGDKLKELKQTAQAKINETKVYLTNTAIAMKLKEFIAKYPNLSLRKVGKGKKRLSINEFISKHLNNKEEQNKEEK